MRPHTVHVGQPAATILVVDHDPAIRTLVRAHLETSTCRVVEADGGEAAKRIAKQAESIDLLLTDVLMPTISGPDLARCLRRRWPALKILYMSDRSLYHLLLQPHIREEGFGFLQKPFAPDALADWVRDLLHLKRDKQPNRGEAGVLCMAF